MELKSSLSAIYTPAFAALFSRAVRSDELNEILLKVKSTKYYLALRRLNDIFENEKIIDCYEDDQTTLNYLKKHDLISKIIRLSYKCFLKPLPLEH